MANKTMYFVTLVEKKNVAWGITNKMNDIVDQIGENRIYAIKRSEKPAKSGYDLNNPIDREHMLKEGVLKHRG